jgi:hypothetical protein
MKKIVLTLLSVPVGLMLYVLFEISFHFTDRLTMRFGSRRQRIGIAEEIVRDHGSFYASGSIQNRATTVLRNLQIS